MYGALEDSISALKLQLNQKDEVIAQLKSRLDALEAGCPKCNGNNNIGEK